MEQSTKITLLINKDDLMRMLRNYFPDEVESCPLNAEAFCEVLFFKYERNP